MTGNSDRYTAVAITLHWVMALGALATLLRLAWRYETMNQDRRCD